MRVGERSGEGWGGVVRVGERSGEGCGGVVRVGERSGEGWRGGSSTNLLSTVRIGLAPCLASSGGGGGSTSFPPRSLLTSSTAVSTSSLLLLPALAGGVWPSAFWCPDPCGFAFFLLFFLLDFCCTAF